MAEWLDDLARLFAYGRRPLRSDFATIPERAELVDRVARRRFLRFAAAAVGLAAGATVRPDGSGFGVPVAQADCEPGCLTCFDTACAACKAGYLGANCDQCAPNYYGYPTCTYCLASSTCSNHGTCDGSGNC